MSHPFRISWIKLDDIYSTLWTLLNQLMLVAIVTLSQLLNLNVSEGEEGDARISRSFGAWYRGPSSRERRGANLVAMTTRLYKCI